MGNIILTLLVRLSPAFTNGMESWVKTKNYYNFEKSEEM
jgi:hypothetical protein